MGQQDPPVNLPRRATVQDCGFLEIAWKRLKELAHQVGAERAAEQPRHDHPPGRVDPPRNPHQNELRDHGNGQRNHQRAKVEDEQCVAAAKLQTREGISGQ